MEGTMGRRIRNLCGVSVRRAGGTDVGVSRNLGGARFGGGWRRVRHVGSTRVFLILSSSFGAGVPDRFNLDLPNSRRPNVQTFTPSQIKTTRRVPQVRRFEPGSLDFSTHFHSRIKSINPQLTPSNLPTSSSLVRISASDSNGASVNKNNS